jgi:NDP-sugar pyrophosphorylase family protein
MDTVNLRPGDSISKGFISQEYLPAGKDEHYIRNEQAAKPQGKWRKLLADELRLLRENGNTAANWDDVMVAGEFVAGRICNSHFHGLVRIGRIGNSVMEYEGLVVAAGITNSTIISCDIGDDCAIHDVHHLAHYIVGDRCILMNIDEMFATECAKFGSGIVKDGEDETSRMWMDIANEAGHRRVLPFDGMLAADACIWAKYRDDAALQKALVAVTQRSFDSRRGCYGRIGQQSVIRSTRLVRDTNIGPRCCIAGASRLANLTINSSQDEPTTIGTDVELSDGIVGLGCTISGGSKAAKFVLADGSNLRLGARVTDTFVGDNSTISCCEVLSNLIFPAHEQHHNNSFLIASLVMGQSNVAAGATIGSNHNSRAADGEVLAGRGFWPGLCTSVKHPSRFASFVLLAKGDYAAELDIPLSFSLVGNNASKDQLEVMPAFWWLYNMYALARNSSKFEQRDRRVHKSQHIEFDFLAPDTAEEILVAMRLLEIWTAKASLRSKGVAVDSMGQAELATMGRELLASQGAKGLEVLGENMEKSRRKVVIAKAQESYQAYSDMLHYYAIKSLLGHKSMFVTMADELCGGQRDWVNLGGQLVPQRDVDTLRADIASGVLTRWNDIHDRYDALWQAYPLERRRHAWAVLCGLSGTERPSKEQWLGALDKAAAIQEHICQQVIASRKKDFDDPFRMITYRSPGEMAAAMGTIDGNSFVEQVRSETTDFRQAVQSAKASA